MVGTPAPVGLHAFSFHVLASKCIHIDAHRELNIIKIHILKKLNRKTFCNFSSKLGKSKLLCSIAQAVEGDF